MEKKVYFQGKITAKGTFVSFATPLNARGEKGRNIASQIKNYIIVELGLGDAFVPPIIFCPLALLERVGGLEIRGEIPLPAPKWAQIKDALERASNSKN